MLKVPFAGAQCVRVTSGLVTFHKGRKLFERWMRTPSEQKHHRPCTFMVKIFLEHSLTPTHRRWKEPHSLSSTQVLGPCQALHILEVLQVPGGRLISSLTDEGQ